MTEALKISPSRVAPAEPIVIDTNNMSVTPAVTDVPDGPGVSRLLCGPLPPQFQPLEAQPSNASSTATLTQRPSEIKRTIYLPRQRTERRFKSNAISTTKYQLWSFLPRFLYEQFRRYSNCFFLLIACLQQIPDVSPTGRWTTLFPLSFILMVSAVKEVIEDTKRRIADTKVNWRKVSVLRDGSFTVCRWYDLRVGDIVRVTNGEPIPADLIIMSSSEPQGIAYIETANLDGETNLKIRQALPETWPLTTEFGLSKFCGIIECEPPNKRLYEFSGSIQQSDGILIGHKRPLGADQMLLRGSRLLNTDTAYGIVIYTGHESKVMLNALRTVPLKRSSMEKLVNAQILLLFSILLCLVLISAICYGAWLQWYLKDQWYLKPSVDAQDLAKTGGVVANHSSWDKVIFSTMTFLILYNNLIPISLQVTLEMVRFFQAYFIGWDRDMYDAETRTFAQARTSTLNEELGQVKYVFSDKTGTLTENKMVYRACSIAGMRFCSAESPIVHQHPTGAVAASSEPAFSGSDDYFNKRLHNILFHGVSGLRSSRSSSPHVNMSMRQQNQALAGGAVSDYHAGGDETSTDAQHRVEAVRLFVTALAVCHTVLPEAGDSENSPNYLASSPDEMALVKAASTIGYKLVRRTPDEVEIKVIDEVGLPTDGTAPEGLSLKFEILNILEFSSDRKRMSLICRDKQTDQIYLFCKGADTVICERLTPNVDDSEQPVPARKYMDATMRDLEDFAAAGYRTLCISYAVIDPQQYYEWDTHVWKPASTAVFDRAGLTARAAELMERNLTLLGATAIEDQLQEDVPNTIESLLQADIKLWVLTGDHQSTAINIGHSCKLLQRDVDPIIINERSLDDVRTCIGNAKQRYRNDIGVRSLVIDGTALQFALHDNLRTEFYELAVHCKSVICCRVSPMQKAEVVGLVKTHAPKRRFLGHQIDHCTTLAIGDGANDVAMIQAANIGIGISGREGMAAVCASDYSIAQFRFLKKLLLVHGAWSHERLSKLILYSFYKNICLYLMQFAYATSSAYSGQTLFERWTIGLYNVLFTMAPPFVIGLFDRTCSIESRMQYPKLYAPSQAGRLFNIQIFWFWVFKAVLHAAVIYLMTRAACHTDVLWGNGESSGGLLVGTMIMSYTIITVCLKAALETQIWTWPAHIGIWGSIAAWFIFFVVYSQVWPIVNIGENMVGMMQALFSSYIFWFGLVLIPLTALLFDLTWKVGVNTFWPRLSEAVRQMEIAGEDDVITYLLRQRNKFARDQVLAELGGTAGLRGARGPGGSDGSNTSSGGSNNSTTQVLRGGGGVGGLGVGAGNVGFLRQRPKTPPETTSLLGMQPVHYRSGMGASAPILLSYMPNALNSPINNSTNEIAGNYNAPLDADNLRFHDAASHLSINDHAVVAELPAAHTNTPYAKSVSIPAAVTPRVRDILRDESFRSRGSLPMFASTSSRGSSKLNVADEHDEHPHENLDVYKRGFAFSQDESNTVAQSQYVSMYESTDNLHHHVQQQQQQQRQQKQQRFSRNSHHKSVDDSSSSRGGSIASSQRQTLSQLQQPPPPYNQTHSTPLRPISQPSLNRSSGGSTRASTKGIALREQQSLPQLLASAAAPGLPPPPQTAAPARLSSQVLLANGGLSNSMGSSIGTPPLQHRAA